MDLSFNMASILGNGRRKKKEDDDLVLGPARSIVEDVEGRSMEREGGGMGGGRKSKDRGERSVGGGGRISVEGGGRISVNSGGGEMYGGMDSKEVSEESRITCKKYLDRGESEMEIEGFRREAGRDYRTQMSYYLGIGETQGSERRKDVVMESDGDSEQRRNSWKSFREDFTQYNESEECVISEGMPLGDKNEGLEDVADQSSEYGFLDRSLDRVRHDPRTGKGECMKFERLKDGSWNVAVTSSRSCVKGEASYFVDPAVLDNSFDLERSGTQPLVRTRSKNMSDRSEDMSVISSQICMDTNLEGRILLSSKNVSVTSEMDKYGSDMFLDQALITEVVSNDETMSPSLIYEPTVDQLQNALTSRRSSLDEKEERMLPDSSLSPSNLPTEYMFDENFRKNVFDNPVLSPSKECTTTTTSHPVQDLMKVEGKVSVARLDIQDDQIVENFLYASQLALVEVKLKDLEEELSSLDKYCFSRFINSVSNLEEIPGQVFIPHLNEASTSTCMANDFEFIEKDDPRRTKLRQIMKKHSDLKRWLSKIKKKLRERNVSKLCEIIDFSSRGFSELPLPEFMTKVSEDKSFKPVQDICGPVVTVNNEHMTMSKSRFDVKDKSHLEYLSHIIDLNCCILNEDDSGTFAKECEAPLEREEEFPEDTYDQPRYYSKNIFDTMQCLSKDGSDPDGIPHLTYEYENCRESDLRYKDNKCNSTDDLIPSTDSDCQHNQNPPTPDLRRAELDCNDISEGIRVLVVQKDNLRAGVIHLANEEDCDQKLWRVTIDGDRKCQDIVMSEWQLLEQGVREVIPTSTSQLSPGTRVCANWSLQLPMNLYPGTITSSPLDHPSNLNKLPIDFDDGDHKDVDLDQVRLLPENFPNLHELMKASNIADSNFYSIGRKNCARRKRIPRQAEVKETQKYYDGGQEKKEGRRGRKKIIKDIDKKKKMVVHWKLVKEKQCSEGEYELVRNLDDLHIRGGDNVQLLSYSRHNYMANVVNVLSRHQGPIMEIELNWYYILSDVQDNSEIIKKLKKSRISKKVIFKTSHSDINDIYSVLRKVEVLPFNEYKLKYLRKFSKKDAPSDCYVMAGRYDQTKTKVENLDENIRLYILSGAAE